MLLRLQKYFLKQKISVKAKCILCTELYSIRNNFMNVIINGNYLNTNKNIINTLKHSLFQILLISLEGKIKTF